LRAKRILFQTISRPHVLTEAETVPTGSAKINFEFGEAGRPGATVFHNNSWKRLSNQGHCYFPLSAPRSLCA